MSASQLDSIAFSASNESRSAGCEGSKAAEQYRHTDHEPEHRQYNHEITRERSTHVKVIRARIAVLSRVARATKDHRKRRQVRRRATKLTLAIALQALILSCHPPFSLGQLTSQSTSGHHNSNTERT